TLVNTGTGLVQGGVMGVHIAGTSASVGNSGRIIGGGNGVDLATTTWSLNNAGTLTNGGTIGGYYAGVWLTGVGTVAVDNTGTMMGSHDGLYFNGQAAALTNSGLVASTTLDNGVSIKAGSANVTNTGIVSGAYDGFYFGTAAGVGTITNAGTISG